MFDPASLSLEIPIASFCFSCALLTVNMLIPFLLVCNAAGLVVLVVLPAARVFVSLFLHVVRLSFRSRPVKANRSYRRRLLRARKRFRPPAAWQRSRPPQSSLSNTACGAGDCTAGYGGLRALHSARHSLWYLPNLLGMGRVENIQGDNGEMPAATRNPLRKLQSDSPHRRVMPLRAGSSTSLATG